MKGPTNFEVIIIGGSYAGLSAGMALGRSLRKVLIIDSGNPCNQQTPHSHNFLTQDGNSPQEIHKIAKQQVEKYETVTFYHGLAVRGKKTSNGFEITTQAGDTFTSPKLVFATGVKDILPDIKGFAECWGISVIHCPYCHGYEVRNEKTGILGNGDFGFDFSKMILQLTNDLRIFTNGKSTLTKDQSKKLEARGIEIIEKEIDSLEHKQGKINHIIFKDGSKTELKALYAKTNFIQQCDIPEQLGCEMTEEGFIKIEEHQNTTVDGVWVCGDNTTFMRSIANAVAMGNLVGAIVNKMLVEEEF